jgi:hypothetical protein
MRSSRPPGLATWWLERFCLGPTNDSLIGDLMEEYERGRSRVWYWRQVLAALSLNFRGEFYSHPLLVARAAATVWSVWYLYAFVFSSSLHRLLIPSPPATGFMWMVGGCTVWAGIGWIVARLHREYKATMLMVFAISVLVCKLPWFYSLVVDSLGNARYRPYLLNEFLEMILTFISILMGGLWGVPSEIEAPIPTEHFASTSVHVRSQDS